MNIRFMSVIALMGVFGVPSVSLAADWGVEFACPAVIHYQATNLNISAVLKNYGSKKDLTVKNFVVGRAGNINGAMNLWGPYISNSFIGNNPVFAKSSERFTVSVNPSSMFPSSLKNQVAVLTLGVQGSYGGASGKQSTLLKACSVTVVP